MTLRTTNVQWSDTLGWTGDHQQQQFISLTLPNCKLGIKITNGALLVLLGSFSWLHGRKSTPESLPSTQAFNIKQWSSVSLVSCARSSTDLCSKTSLVR